MSCVHCGSNNDCDCVPFWRLPDNEDELIDKAFEDFVSIQGDEITDPDDIDSKEAFKAGWKAARERR